MCDIREARRCTSAPKKGSCIFLSMEKKIVDQKEYLKKYLSSNVDDDKKKKKKKKKLKVGAKTVKIIDDDIDLKNMRPIGDNEFDIFIDTEDAPQIAGIVDERGQIDFADRKRWKIIADNDGGDISFASNTKDRMKDNGNDVRNISETSRKGPDKHASDDDISPPRKQRNYSDDDLSPPRISKSSKEKKQVKRMTKDTEDDDSDLSPPRTKKNNKYKDHKRTRKSSESSSSNDSNSGSDAKSRKYKKKQKSKNAADDSDLSPPRKNKKYDSDLSPPRRKKQRDHNVSLESKNKDNDSDLSPPRRNKKYNSDLSTSRKKKGVDSDLSPPRKSNTVKNSDFGNSRNDMKYKHSDRNSYRNQRNKYNNARSGPSKNDNNRSDSDLSPPRKSRINDDSGSPSRQFKRYENSHSKSAHRSRHNDTDLSPPRRSKQETESHRDDRRHKYSDRNISKSNRNHNDSDRNISKSNRHHNDSDKNISKSNRNHNDSDLSPPRRSSYEKSKIDKRKDKCEHNYSDSNTSQTRSRSSRWEPDNRSECSPAGSPEHNKRMKKTLDGKTAGLQDAKALREETEAHKKREAEHFSKLSKDISGVGKAAIVRDTKTGKKRNLEAEAAEEREKQKRQDELNEKYVKWGKGLKQVEDRQQQMHDDLYEMSKPLARYADDADLDKHLREQDREGDPMLNYIKQKQIKEGKRQPDLPRYEGSFMPNRFGIKPGHRWDGVDRSNGYEKKWFEAQNAKVAVQEEAYKWSTSDM